MLLTHFAFNCEYLSITFGFFLETWDAEGLV